MVVVRHPMKISFSVFIFSILLIAASGESISTKFPAVSEAELLDRFTIAAKAKDEAAIRSLICWDGPVVKAPVNRNISDLLSREEITTIRMHPLHPLDHLTNLLDGSLYYPNIPVIGWIDVHWRLGESAVRFLYGKKKNAFYISCTAEQKLP